LSKLGYSNKSNFYGSDQVRSEIAQLWIFTFCTIYTNTSHRPP